MSRLFAKFLSPMNLSNSITRCCSSAATPSESRRQKLERIAEELLDLTKLEHYDYNILFRFKLGLNRYGPAVPGRGFSPSSSKVTAETASESKEEKTVFDVKLENFDAAAKIKVIKEVRAFTALGLKEAKDLVEKAPVLVMKGVSKEEADSIVAKLKGLGAMAVLE